MAVPISWKKLGHLVDSSYFLQRIECTNWHESALLRPRQLMLSMFHLFPLIYYNLTSKVLIPKWQCLLHGKS